MRKKLLLVISVVVLALVVGSVFISGSLNTHTAAVTKKEKVDAALTSAVGYGTDTILYISGSNFVTRNLKTGESKNLTGNTGTDGLLNVHSLSVSKDKKYILFRDELATADSALAKALQDAQLSAEGGYWWVYDIAGQTFHPIPQDDSLQARLDGDSVMVLASANSYTTITTYSLDGLKKRSTISTPAATDFLVAPDGFLLQYSGDTYLTKDGVISRKVLSNTTLLNTTTDGQYAIGISGKKDVNELVVVKTADWSVKKIASGVNAGVAWRDPDLILYSIDLGSETKPDNRLYAYNLTTGKTTAWDTGVKDSTYSAQAVFDETSGLVSDADGNYYVLGTDLKNYPVN